MQYEAQEVFTKPMKILSKFAFTAAAAFQRFIMGKGLENI
jgi:hypothetical protein